MSAVLSVYAHDLSTC